MIVNAKFLCQKLTGVQRFAIEISKRLKELDNSLEFVAPHGVLDEDVKNELNVRTIGNSSGHYWEQVELPKYLRSRGNPLLLCLTGSSPVFYKNKIFTLHDLGFKRTPESLSIYYRYFYRVTVPLSIKRSRHILTVSEYSKSDIVDVYGVSLSKVTTIYNAVAKSFYDQKIMGGEKEKTILTVGSIQPYKNVSTLIEAYLDLKESGGLVDYKLKIVGSSNSKVFSNVTYNESGRDLEGVEFTGYLSDEDLAKEYMKASVFVFPSLFEGFGIPPLEAMACGCPVIASNTTSIPEVCGSAAAYFDPLSVSDLKGKILSVLTDDSYRSKLILEGYSNIERFDWSDSASKLYAVLKDYC